MSAIRQRRFRQKSILEFYIVPAIDGTNYPNWTDNMLKHFKHYRGAAKPYLPKLEEYAARYKANKGLAKNERFQKEMAKTLEMIENDTNPPVLTSWKDL